MLHLERDAISRLALLVPPDVGLENVVVQLRCQLLLLAVERDHDKVLERVAKSQSVPGRRGCQKSSASLMTLLKRSTPSITLAWEAGDHPCHMEIDSVEVTCVGYLWGGVGATVRMYRGQDGT